jgi:CRISPR-associated protein Cas6
VNGLAEEVAIEAAMVDLAFPLRGDAMIADYAWRLWLAVSARLPWLDGEPGAGIHPLAGVSGGGEVLYMSRRARLVLRLPRERVAAAQSLAGVRLDLGDDCVVTVDGFGTERALWPAPVLYAPFVYVDCEDEGEFLQECRRRMPAAGERMICGKARSAARDGGTLRGFSLMLHDLDAQASIDLQCSGLGEERRLGCGIFVPHKSVAAVGS